MKILTDISYKTSTFPFIVILISLLFSVNVKANYEYWESYTPEYSASPVQIDIVGDHGNILNTYTANSNKHDVKRAYLEAVKGEQYAIRVRNTSNRRVGIVIAVDGRNILTGKKSWLGKNEKMYVLDPHETSSYKGWRTSKNQVNRFYFTSAGDSYADAWNDRSAMGVIAVAVYKEKPRREYYNKYKQSIPNSMNKSRSGYLADESAGTGFGEELYSPTRRVKFKAMNRPAVKHFFKYEWRKTLCKKGIIECNNFRKYPEDNRFWPDEDYIEENEGYAPYPPGYHSNNHYHRRFKKQHNKTQDYKNQKWIDQFKNRWDTNYNRSW